ncbi:MAG: phosphoribosyl-AMP cyclohydrolase, partial [Bosea sp.]|uniref:phosphoribosyl-AMP cyclohydrolase n=1 Tax=Bosea sp. (in: a-proteobacteria) TaxID=1871050 RepID=UPI00239C85F8|nr:phosphoribosyl-AMP cyclohydrolase [Bosea sp. (in: a-proteobacteria)]
MTAFPVLSDKHALEDGTQLAPRFDTNGLITCVTTDAETGELLMVAHMNADALGRSIETGEAWYWSRSRQQLWHKGDTSGQVQTIVEMRIDCDQDALIYMVEPQGDGACHTKDPASGKARSSCFYRKIDL